MLGLVRLHGLAECLRQFAAVLHLPHVDEVDGDDAPHVPQTQEPGDFLGALQIRGGGVLFLGGRTGLPSTGVHVDHVHGLGVLDDEVGSTPEVDLAAEARLDHPVHAAVVEDIFGLGQLDDVHLVRRVGREVFLDLLGHLRVVDQNLGEVGVEQVPKQGARLVDLAEDPLAVLGPPQVLVEFLPAVGEILEVGMQVGSALLLRHRSHDDAAVLGANALQQDAEALALTFLADALADADFLGEGNEHEVAAREGHLRGEARPLGGDGLLGHLDEDGLASRHHVLHVSLLVDVRFELEVAEVGRGLRSFDGPLGILFEAAVLRPEIEVVEKGILGMTDVHKSCVQAGQHLLDPAEVDVPDRIFLVAIVFMEFDQMAVFQHGNAQPGLGLVDDQFDVHASRKVGVCHGHEPDRHPPVDVTSSSCDGSYGDASSSCARPSYGACASFHWAWSDDFMCSAAGDRCVGAPPAQ